MRPGYFLHLLRLHLRQYPGRVVLAFVVLVVASALMLLLADMGAALRFRVGGRLAQMFPEERMRLEVQRGQLGPLAIETTSITSETVTALRARPEVAEVLPIEPVRIPIMVQGNLFGQEIASDAVVHGVPRELVADAIAPTVQWSAPTTTSVPYPIVASHYFLDLYNLGMARSSGLPLLSPSAIIGRHMYVVLGRSSVVQNPQAGDSGVVRAEIVGISRDPSLIGLAMPEAAVRAFNKAFGHLDKPEYVALVVKLRAGSDGEAFLAAMRKQGLTMSSSEAIGRRVKSAVRMAGWGLIGLAIAVFVLGMLTFYMLFAMIFHSRRLDLVRLRALGVGPAALLGLALGEVVGVAVVAVILAGGLNYAAMWKANALAGDWLKTQVWLPPNLLEPSIGWLALTSAVILVATLAAALPMLRWVFRVEPGLVLRDM